MFYYLNSKTVPCVAKDTTIFKVSNFKSCFLEYVAYKEIIASCQDCVIKQNINFICIFKVRHDR